MKISFLTSAHPPKDDRIYHHMACSLFEKGHQVEIISSTIKMEENTPISINSFEGVSISKTKKIETFISKLTYFKPTIIICSEPITILAAKKYSKVNNTKIIYDITEWYPSKKNLQNHNKVSKGLYFFKYLFFYLYTTSLSDAFIFGEHYKSKIPRLLFPNKPFQYISYFPDIKYIHKQAPKLKQNIVRLCYSGKISIEKGFINFINVLQSLSSQNSSLLIIVKIIGWYDHKDESLCKNMLKKLPEKVQIQEYKLQELNSFVKLINDTDIFLDLRTNDIENSHCLPIKLFYFMALERPVIYSNLKAIKTAVEIKEFGHLIAPHKTQEIVKTILTYLQNPEIYYKHCSKARELYELKYNWKVQEASFLAFVSNIGKL